MNKRLFNLFSLAGVIVLTGASCISFGGSSREQGPLGLFRSTDKGENWVAATAYPTPEGTKSIANLRVYRTFTDPSDDSALYVGSRNQGLFYTYNFGTAWQTAEFFKGKFIYAVAVDPNNKCVVYVSDGPHIYKSTDCNRNWSLVYTEERPNDRVVSLAVDFENSNLVYAAIQGGDLLVSTDGGSRWQASKRFNFDLRHIAADPFKPNRIYVGTEKSGAYRSDDAGTTFINLSSDFGKFSESKNFYRLILHPSRPNSLFWVSKYGVLTSNDAGVTWGAMKLITPPGSVNIYSFAINPKNEQEMYYIGTILGEKSTHVRSTFYKSDDGGFSWTTKKLPTNTIPISLNIHPQQDNALLVGFTSLQ